MVKLTEVVCGVGNVIQNKGGIGAYVRVDRTTFLFVAAHLAAHQARASAAPQTLPHQPCLSLVSAFPPVLFTTWLSFDRMVDTPHILFITCSFREDSSAVWKFPHQWELGLELVS